MLLDELAQGMLISSSTVTGLLHVAADAEELGALVFAHVQSRRTSCYRACRW